MNVSGSKQYRGCHPAPMADAGPDLRAIRIFEERTRPNQWLTSRRSIYAAHSGCVFAYCKSVRCVQMVFEKTHHYRSDDHDIMLTDQRKVMLADSRTLCSHLSYQRLCSLVPSKESTFRVRLRLGRQQRNMTQSIKDNSLLSFLVDMIQEKPSLNRYPV